MENLQTLFTSQENTLKLMKKNFPRILHAEIKESGLYINFYGVDDMEYWLEDYKQLESSLKETFNKFFHDKQYYIRVVTSI